MSGRYSVEGPRMAMFELPSTDDLGEAIRMMRAHGNGAWVYDQAIDGRPVDEETILAWDEAHNDE